MRRSGPLGYALSGSAVLALLAGCSGGGGSSSPTPLSPSLSQPQSTTRSASAVFSQNRMSHSVLRPDIAPILSTPNMSADFAEDDAAKKGAVIVSDSGTNTVVVLTTTGKKTATISKNLSEPQGLGGDSSGNLYIANTANSDIVVYKNDYKTVVATLLDASQYPVGVDVAKTTGLVGVTNIISTASGPGSVSFFTKGTTKPCVTVANSTWARVYFGAFDATGNFFVDGSDANGAVLVGEVTGGCKAKTITTLKVSNALTFPGGVQVTPAGKIVVDDQSGSAIYTYNAPVKGSLGKPIATTPLTGASDPVTFAFTKKAGDLFTADAGLAESLEYTYPKGGAAIKTFTGFTQPIGVTVTPLEVP